MTRVAIVSDIHGNLPALEAIVADAEGQGARAFWNLGDSLSGPLWPAETCDWLIAAGWPSLAGNHERQLLTLPPERMGESDRFTRECLKEHHRAWLEACPDLLRPQQDVLLCHGTPQSDVQHWLHTVEAAGFREAGIEEIEQRAGGMAERIAFCGHSHVPREVQLGDGRRVINVGSGGLQAYDDDHLHAYRVEMGSPQVRYVLWDGGHVTFRAVDYDWQAAGDKAEREGRPDWAIALRTGRMN
jgi:predicted phosphodiesterase